MIEGIAGTVAAASHTGIGVVILVNVAVEPPFLEEQMLRALSQILGLRHAPATLQSLKSA